MLRFAGFGLSLTTPEKGERVDREMSVLASASYHLELIDGVEIEKPLPKRPHWVVQAFFDSVVRTYLDWQEL